MVQSINPTQKNDEPDGLPMPKRIWAVVSVGFALCMSVLDINIVNIVLPTLSHDFGAQSETLGDCVKILIFAS